jgi:hypothetical protein
MNHSYSASSYDDFLCIKPPLLLWIAVLYLARAVALPIVWGLSSLAAMSPEARTLIFGLTSPSGLVPSLVAAAVLYALFRRVPAASDRVRWIWARGRSLLAVSAVMDLALSLAQSPLWRPSGADASPMPLLAAAFDLYFLVYILTTRRVRDTFADFPARAH